jgi:hypothetical protein
VFPSTLLYGGALLALLGLAALVVPRRLLRRRPRPWKPALSAVAIGVGLLTLGVALPVRERAVRDRATGSMRSCRDISFTSATRHRWRRRRSMLTAPFER